MALANITVTATTPNVSVTAGTTNVSVSQTTSNVTVGTATGVATSEIRSALSNTSPILYDSSTGVFSFDNTAILNATVVDNGSLSGNITLDLDAGRIHKVALGLGNITGITLNNITSGAAATIIFTQDAGGGIALDTTTHASNWTSWDFANDFKTFDDNPLNWTVMNLFYDGTVIYASLVTDSAGNITNDELANSNVIVNGVTIDLGSSGTITANMDLTALSVTTNSPSGNGALSYNNTSGVFSFTPADASTGGIALTDLSVTTVSPSGNGALAYNNTTGVFSFTPSDVPDNTDELSEGSTNQYFTTARANSAIADYTGAITNMTGNLTTTGIITGGASATDTHNLTGNLNVTGNVEVSGNLNYRNVEDLQVQNTELIMNANAATDSTVSFIVNRPVAGANTVLRWNETDDKWQFSNDGSAYQDISGLTNAQAQSYIQSSGLSMTANIDSTKSINLTYPDTVLEGIKIVSDTASSGLTILDVTSARSGDAGPQQFYRKSAGSIASPTAIGTRDYIKREKYFGHDGTDYLETMGMMVYQDSDVGSVSTNVVPLAYEIYTEQGGDVNHGFNQSIVRFDADRNIIFNDTGTRTFGNGQGNANIKMDGTINTVSSINATGNVVSSANINAAGGTLTGILTSDSNVVTTAFFEGDLNGAVTIDVNNNTGSTLNKGEAVYLDGGNTGDTPNVALANSQVAANMPAIGIVRENISSGAIGQVVTSGVMNIASHGLTLGADIFIGTGGGITNTKPTGESGLIQKIGKVVSANHIIVQGAFRTNATPNLNDGNFFLGNAGNQAVSTSFSSEANTAIAANLLALTGNIDTTASLNFTADTSDLALITAVADTPSSGTTILDITSARTGDGGPQTFYRKATGSIASPGAISTRDYVYRERYEGHDGTDYQETMGYMVYQDSDVGGVSSNIVPLAYEFYTHNQGNVNAGFIQSLIRMDSNRNIIFNDDGTRTFGGGQGNANITQDGTINTVSDVNATGNITATANINAAGGTLTGVVTSNSNITTTANVSGNYILGNGSQLTGLTSGVTNAQAQAYIQSNGLAMTSNIDTTSSINFTADSSDDTLIKMDIDAPSSGTNFIDITAARSGDAGPQAFYRKGTGSIASPGALGTRDYVYREKFFGHDGTDYLETFGMFVYQDNSSITGGSVSANVVPLAMEFYTEQDGDVNHGFNQSIMRMTPSRTIEFNDTGTRTFGQGYGNANITMDGTINSESDIKAANAVFTDKIFSYTPGGTFTLTSIRVNDFRANDPLGIDDVANSSLSGGVYAAPFTGSIVYVTGDRHGSRGAPAYWDGTNWRYFSDDALVTI